MAKRFIDPDIWKKQRWFRVLKPDYKLSFLYIISQCDHAGIWNIDCSDLIEDTGIEEDFDIDHFLGLCNIEFNKKTGKKNFKERLRLLPNGYIWVTQYIQWQCGPNDGKGLCSIRSGPVISALKKLATMDLLSDAIENRHVKLTGIPKNMGLDMEKLANLPPLEEGASALNTGRDPRKWGEGPTKMEGGTHENGGRDPRKRGEGPPKTEVPPTKIPGSTPKNEGGSREGGKMTFETALENVSNSTNLAISEIITTLKTNDLQNEGGRDPRKRGEGPPKKGGGTPKKGGTTPFLPGYPQYIY